MNDTVEVLRLERNAAVVNAFKALLFSTAMFVLFFQFMPKFWQILAEQAAMPKVAYDVLGFGGLALIGMSVLAMTNGLFGKQGGKNLLFIDINIIGGLMHLMSFGYYYNPNGITLDTCYFLLGLYGRYKVMSEAPVDYQEDETAPSITRFCVIVGGALLGYLALVVLLWAGVMEVTSSLNQTLFHQAGLVGGICILTAFAGLMFGWIDGGSLLYKVIYVSGVLCFLTNLSIEYNPFTIALEFVCLTFLFVSLRKST